LSAAPVGKNKDRQILIDMGINFLYLVYLSVNLAKVAHPGGKTGR
jgi:hypothetical protein